MFMVPSCAILLWMSRRSCSVTQNSMRIGLVRSAIGYSPPSNYNGHFKRKTWYCTKDFSEHKNLPSLYNGQFRAKTWYPLRKNFLSLYNGHFLRLLAGRAKVIFWNRIPPPTLQRTIFCELGGGSPQKTFQFTTDIFSEKNRGLLENKNAPGLGKSGSIVICGYEISENSKHSRCPYTAAK